MAFQKRYKGGEGGPQSRGIRPEILLSARAQENLQLLRRNMNTNCPDCKTRMQYKMTDYGQVYKCHTCKREFDSDDLERIEEDS